MWSQHALCASIGTQTSEAPTGGPHFPAEKFSRGVSRYSRVGVRASVSCIIYACVALVSFGRDVCAHLESVCCV